MSPSSSPHFSRPPEISDGQAGPIRWAVSRRCHPGEDVCGDGYLAHPTPNGLLLMVSDGLGHGPWARRASLKAVESVTEALEQHLPMTGLVDHCSRMMRPTRGAAISFAFLEPSQHRLHWLGIGNVEGAIFSAATQKFSGMMLRGGIVGQHLPPVRFSKEAFLPGDCLIMATDGLDQNFRSAMRPAATALENAPAILESCDKGNDDALVLVASYLSEEEGV